MNWKILAIIITIIIVVLTLVLTLIVKVKVLQDIKEENELFKTILIVGADISEISSCSQKADNYYLEASYNYEDGLYKSLESNCRLARTYYLETSQSYKKIKSKLTFFGIEDPLIDIYQDMLSSLIDVSNNMFEACEYWESSARYYDTYYNSGVIYDDQIHVSGTDELEMHNEKIRARDVAVEKYNQYFADYTIELESKLE